VVTWRTVVLCNEFGFRKALPPFPKLMKDFGMRARLPPSPESEQDIYIRMRPSLKSPSPVPKHLFSKPQGAPAPVISADATCQRIWGPQCPGERTLSNQYSLANRG
jgi:hypothetical protein